MNSQTKTGSRVAARIAQYMQNPIENPVPKNGVKKTMAKAKRSAAQIAAFKKMRAAGAAALKRKYGTSDIGKIRRAGGARRGKKRRARATALSENVTTTAKQEETMQLEENPKGKKRGKRRGKKRKATRKQLAALAKGRASQKRKRKGGGRKKSRKGSRRGKRRATRTTTTGKVHVVKLPSSPRIQDVRIVEKKRRKGKRRKKRSGFPRGMTGTLRANPAGGGGGLGELFENPGPFSKESLVGFGWAAAGVGLGLAIARGVDRFVSTRAPADSGAMTGQNPWMGRDAAAAFNRRPDAIRLGVQGVGALAGIGAAYMTRNRRGLPWLFGGIGLGFGSNLLLQVIEWMIMPRILKVENANESSLANRLYPLEQIAVQDTIDGYFENWSTVASLAEGQQNPAIIQGPLSDGGGVYTLGEAGANPLLGAAGGLISNGRLGSCGSCGGYGGCYPGCQSMGGCKGCGDGGPRRFCSYVVQPGDNLNSLLAATNTPLSAVDALNSSSAAIYWQPGNSVLLPFEVCVRLNGGVPAIPEQPGLTATPAIPSGGYGNGSAPGGMRPGPGSAPVYSGSAPPPFFRATPPGAALTVPASILTATIAGTPDSVYVPNDGISDSED